MPYLSSSLTLYYSSPSKSQSFDLESCSLEPSFPLNHPHYSSVDNKGMLPSNSLQLVPDLAELMTLQSQSLVMKHCHRNVVDCHIKFMGTNPRN